MRRICMWLSSLIRWVIQCLVGSRLTTLLKFLPYLMWFLTPQLICHLLTSYWVALSMVQCPWDCVTEHILFYPQRPLVVVLGPPSLRSFHLFEGETLVLICIFASQLTFCITCDLTCWYVELHLNLPFMHSKNLFNNQRCSLISWKCSIWLPLKVGKAPVVGSLQHYLLLLCAHEQKIVPIIGDPLCSWAHATTGGSTWFSSGWHLE